MTSFLTEHFLYSPFLVVKQRWIKLIIFKSPDWLIGFGSRGRYAALLRRFHFLVLKLFTSEHHLRPLVVFFTRVIFYVSRVNQVIIDDIALPIQLSFAHAYKNRRFGLGKVESLNSRPTKAENIVHV